MINIYHMGRGTGKTKMAIERTIFLNKCGINTAIITYSRDSAKYIQKTAKEYYNYDIDAYSYEEFSKLNTKHLNVVVDNADMVLSRLLGGVTMSDIIVGDNDMSEFNRITGK